MIPALLAKNSRRTTVIGCAGRSARREPASANSLGRVVPVAWTATRLASAASLGSKPAGAGCAPTASAERCGSPGLLYGDRGGSAQQVWRLQPAFIVASISTRTDAGLDATKRLCRTQFTSKLWLKCPLTVCDDTSCDTLRRSRSASPGWAMARSGLRGSGGVR